MRPPTEKERQELKATISRQNESIKNYEDRIVHLHGQLDDKDAELRKRVHGLTAFTFAVLAFAVGIIVGGNISTRAKAKEVVAETNQVTWFTNYTVCETGGTSLMGTDSNAFGNVTNAAPARIYLSTALKKGAELLRKPSGGS